jgi:hypothetical protein
MEAEMTLSRAVQKVIDLAGAVRDYYETELQKRYPNYPLVDENAESVPPPPAEKELRAFLESLSIDILYQLYVIMNLGLGEFGASDVGKSYEELKDRIGDAEHAVAEMMHYKAPLADRLTDGLEELRRHNIDVSRMPLRKAKVRKRQL